MPFTIHGHEIDGSSFRQMLFKHGAQGFRFYSHLVRAGHVGLVNVRLVVNARASPLQRERRVPSTLKLRAAS